MGVEERTDYNGLGQETRHVDRRGVERRFQRDMLGREVGEVLVESLTRKGTELVKRERRWTDTPDSQGRVKVEEVDAEGNTQDAACRSTYIDRRGMATVVVVVDGRGEEERRRRGKGEVRVEERWERNEAGQVVRAVDGNGVATDFEYNGAGQQVAWTVAAGTGQAGAPGGGEGPEGDRPGV